MAKPHPPQDLAGAARLAKEGRFADAEQMCRRVLKRAKHDAAPWHLLGVIATMQGQNDEAVTRFGRALKIRPGEPGTLCELGRTKSLQGRYDEAAALYGQVIDADPSNMVAVAGRAGALRRLGDEAAAATLLAPLLDAGREDAAVAFVAVEMRQRAGQHAEAVDLARRHLERSGTPPNERWQLLFALGRSLERLEDIDGSFEAYREANELFRRPFRIEDVRRGVDELIRIFDRGALDALARSSLETELPVFVVSLPRSGSTLTEQILAAHPQVHGMGESDDLARIVHHLPDELRTRKQFPDFVGDLDVKTVERLGNRYVGRLRTHDRAALRIVNKHLGHFRYLGLIWMLFPRARIIHCRREPMALGFSCFMLDLSPVAAPWSSDLRSIGLYMREFERLMDHWSAVLDTPTLDVRYEDLVGDQEGVSRRLIEFCGLPWDERCLRYYESDRVVATPSFGQVRTPIYRDAIERWRKYEAHLGPLVEALGEG